ncbi:hypothetical protein D082_31170 [Synechocystis sp. PCC 6714]|nr:hypothetical protein D082_31170 [Synechocystis sp. PCC 6714]
MFRWDLLLVPFFCLFWGQLYEYKYETKPAAVANVGVIVKSSNNCGTSGNNLRLKNYTCPQY